MIVLKISLIYLSNNDHSIRDAQTGVPSMTFSMVEDMNAMIKGFLMTRSLWDGANMILFEN